MEKEAQPGPQVGPQTRPASRVALTANHMEFLLTFGASRVVIDPKSGTPKEELALEWLATFALSPMLAKKLGEMLTSSVRKYEEISGAEVPLPPAQEEKAKEGSAIDGRHKKK